MRLSDILFYGYNLGLDDGIVRFLNAVYLPLRDDFDIDFFCIKLADAVRFADCRLLLVDGNDANFKGLRRNFLSCFQV